MGWATAITAGLATVALAGCGGGTATTTAGSPTTASPAASSTTGTAPTAGEESPGPTGPRPHTPPAAATTPPGEPIELTDDHPCGLGFQTASADQRYALLLWPADASTPPPGGSVELPSPDWNAELQVGEDLMANWCDDVLEPGEPTPHVTATWPVTAGTLTFAPPPSPGCGGDAVTARITGLEITAPDGETIALPDRFITNDAYGCVAG